MSFTSYFIINESLQEITLLQEVRIVTQQNKAQFINPTNRYIYSAVMT